MLGFSTVDGFVEITECLAEMIKYVANEPSVGLFYIQQHSQNAVPNLVSLNTNIVAKSRETALHTEDTEDSITMVRSMKECGSPIADEMIKDIKKSLVLMSAKQPKRGLIQNPISGFPMGRASSWGPANWGRSAVYSQEEDAKKGGYFSTVVKSAKQKASNLKWVQLDSKELVEMKGDKPKSYHNPSLSTEAGSTSSTFADTEAEAEELPLSSQAADEQQQYDEVQGVPSCSILKVEENFDDFKADKEAKLEKWLEGTAKLDNHGGEANDADI